MTTLIIGASSRALSPLPALFQHANLPVLLTSRHPEKLAASGLPAVSFDWAQPSSWTAALDTADPPVTRVAVIGPEGNEPALQVNPFIDVAVGRGVRRFVVVTGRTQKNGGPWFGQIWAHLSSANVEFSMLRALWINENLTVAPQRDTIRDEGRIYSASADGVCQWVAARDIAAVAFRALTTTGTPREVYDVQGPRGVTMDEIAEALGKALGKPVKHVRLSDEEFAAHLQKHNVDPWYAGVLGYLEKATREGNFDADGKGDVAEVTGVEPLDIKEWAESKKAVWK